MQPQGVSRKKIALILMIIAVVFIGLAWLITILSQKDENQFGKFIRIQNYESKVKNLSNEMRDAIESTLYNVTDKNTDDANKPLKVNDAIIRDGSDSQTFVQRTNVYSGTFIVDMESIKQSYQVQYSYSTSNTVDVGGSPVVVSCLPKEKLKYGEFKCSDFVGEQASTNELILQYLPFQNFSFRLTPDATQGDTLVINARLTIPDSDLKGNAASRAEIVLMYKQEVDKWIRSKGLDPSNYIVKYNYDDAGNLIPDPGHQGD